MFKKKVFEFMLMEVRSRERTACVNICFAFL